MDEWKGIVYFRDVTEKNVQKLDDRLSDMKLKEVSRWNYHKKLKMFIQKAVEDGFVKTNPYKRMDIKRGGDDGLRRCLTPDEFKLFERCTIPTPHLERVRDLFVFQTYTMMGYSDLKAFDYRKCEQINGQMVYRSKRVKTDQPFTIALLKPALDILEKYNYNLPIITNERYNEYLKEAVGFAHITKPVSTHWARHTGATLLINAGIPMHIIQHILGHSTIRETERTYAKVLDSTIVETMATYQMQHGQGRFAL
jgi:site-specific recombinase XerD